jgi:hypothetical protein
LGHWALRHYWSLLHWSLGDVNLLPVDVFSSCKNRIYLGFVVGEMNSRVGYFLTPMPVQNIGYSRIYVLAEIETFET